MALHCSTRRAVSLGDYANGGLLFSRDSPMKHRGRKLSQLRSPHRSCLSPFCAASSEEKITGLSVEELKERLVEEIGETEWFITGRVNKGLFSDRFRFQDPSVKLDSIDAYASGVARLFDPVSEMDIVQTKITGDREIEMVWRLEATINFPFKPKVKAYYVTTYFRTNEEGLISEQEDFFSVPEWELLISVFLPEFGTPPAPPVEKS